MDYIFIDRNTGKLYFIYLPIEDLERISPLKFLRQLINSAFFSKEVKSEDVEKFLRFLSEIKEFSLVETEKFIMRESPETYGFEQPPEEFKNASLVRSSNGEVFSLNQPVMQIGKEKAAVDICITGSKTISRVHAVFIRKNGKYYIIDKNSTNGTFLNGNRLEKEVEILLNENDEIRFADEFFIFRL